MARHGLPGHRDISALSGEATVSGNLSETSALRRGGRDHVAGGGASSMASNLRPVAMIALADGTRITFASTQEPSER